MPTPAPPQVTLPSSRTLGRILVSIMIVLLLLHAAVLVERHAYGHGYVFGLADRFDMDHEGNVPTLFTVLVLLGAAALAGLHAAIERARAGTHVTAWALMSMGLFWLGFDDGAEVHELVSRYARPIVTEGEPLGVAIVALGAAALLAIAWRARPFLRSLPGSTRSGLVIAAALYVAAAVGLEVAGWQVWRAYGLDSLEFSLLATLEEVLEMAAAILFLLTLRRHLGAREREVRVALDRPDPSAGR